MGLKICKNSPQQIQCLLWFELDLLENLKEICEALQKKYTDVWPAFKIDVFSRNKCVETD